MSKLEGINLESKATPELELTAKEREVSEKIEGIFRKNATLESELLNPEDSSLNPERIAELQTDLRLITEQTKKVRNELPKAGEADSHRYDMAA